MTWFCAHIIIGMKPKEGVPNQIDVWENIVLLEASTVEEAGSMANALGKEEEGIDDGLTVNGEPAVRIFAGVRKLVRVSNPHPLDLDNDRPVSKTEVTYSEYTVDDEESLLRLASGESIEVQYVA